MFDWVVEIVGRNRESRPSEAAGRGNSPEAKPRKMNGRKRVAYCTQKQPCENQSTGAKIGPSEVACLLGAQLPDALAPDESHRWESPGSWLDHFRMPTTREQSPLERLPVPSKVQVVTSQRSDRTHAAAKQPVPMATPMAGARNQ
jgi:hypothetical protein